MRVGFSWRGLFPIILQTLMWNQCFNYQSFAVIVLKLKAAITMFADTLASTGIRQSVGTVLAMGLDITFFINSLAERICYTFSWFLWEMTLIKMANRLLWDITPLGDSIYGCFIGRFTTTLQPILPVHILYPTANPYKRRLKYPQVLTQTNIWSFNFPDMSDYIT